MEKGTIIKNISNQYVVLMEDGEQRLCVAMGKLRQDRKPLVGDHVLVEQFEHQYGIQKIEERKNFLIRPAIANVDQALIVMSCKDPDFSTVLIDRLIFLISLANITPVLCVSKMDLLKEDDPVHKEIDDYRKSGYEVFVSGTDFNEDELIASFNNKITVLTGQSGAGKSSLLNRINPDFKLHTQVISKALGRGKHTTRHAQLYPIGDGWVADTPGFSSLDFSRLELSDLAKAVPDFKEVSAKCRFRDCVHLNEPDCAVKQGVENSEVSAIRYRNYVDLTNLIKQNKTKF